MFLEKKTIIYSRAPTGGESADGAAPETWKERQSQLEPEGRQALNVVVYVEAGTERPCAVRFESSRDIIKD